jgi:hypothetical protein
MEFKFVGEAGPGYPISAKTRHSSGVETHANAIPPITIDSRIYLPPAAQTAAVTAEPLQDFDRHDSSGETADNALADLAEPIERQIPGAGDERSRDHPE